MKNKFKILALAAVLVLVLSLAACDLMGGELSSVSISQTSGDLGVGETLRITAVAYRQNGAASAPDASVEISWVSTNQSVLTVDQGGLVTALSEGQATVIAIAKDGTIEKRASCDFDVRIIPVEGISFAGETAEVAKGYTLTLQPIFEPANASNKKIVWESGDESIASVSDKGVVTGHNAGNATITATTEDGQKTASCTVTVKYVTLLTISIPQSEISVAKGAASQIEVNFYPTNASNKTVTWYSDTPYVATIDKYTGMLEAKNMGTATITATSQEGGFTATCTVTVTEPNVTHMAIVLPAPEIVIGQTVELAANVYPTEAVDTFTWYISDERIATITPASNGKTAVVKGITEGTVTVTCVTGTNHIMATTMISVKIVRPKTIELSTYNLDIIVPSGYDGAKQAIFGNVFATLDAEAATAEVVWSSSNENVFTVVPTADSRSVVIKAVGKGTATLRAMTNSSGVSAECTVAVGEIVKTTEEFLDRISHTVRDETIFLEANDNTYNITSFTVPPRTIRIVGITKLNSDGTFKRPKVKCDFVVGNYASLILENIDLEGNAPLTISGSEESYFRNCIIKSTLAENALNVSGDAKVYLDNVKLGNNDGICKALGNSVIVLNDCSYGTATVETSVTSRIIYKNLGINTVNVIGSGKTIAMTTGESKNISALTREIFESLFIAQGRHNFNRDYIKYEVVSSGITVSGSTVTAGSAGTYNLKAIYTYGTTDITADDLTLTFQITVTAP